MERERRGLSVRAAPQEILDACNRDAAPREQRGGNDDMQKQIYWSALFVIPFLASACSVFGIRTTEEAGYEVLVEDGDFELREYEQLVVVETLVGGDLGEKQNTAFFRLFDYISGENSAQQKIAMTAPVLQEPESVEIEMTAPVFQEQTEGGWKMSFVLPREYTLENAPAPTNQNVALRQIQPKRVASIRYSGLRSETKMERQVERLHKWIEAQGLSVQSGPRSAAYDPPFTLPFLRRNEVLIEVDSTQP
ncbi:MAG: hypothetical protein ACI82F_003444 [Planctomycetota bacterium]|jgi:hypothetical protein